MYEVSVKEVLTKEPDSLRFTVEVTEPAITSAHTAQVIAVLTNTESESETVGVSANAPVPWVSEKGSPPIMLIPLKTYPEVERTSETCWEPERDTFSRLLKMTPEQRKQMAANNLRDIIAELEVEHPAGVPHEVLAAEADARLDVGRLSVETRLKSLQRRDEITEPRADHFLTA